MNLIKSITIKNYKAIRDEQKIELLQGSYIIGANNSGKTTILQAIDFFFNKDLPYDEQYLNRSEYLGKKSEYNKSVVSIEINLEAVITKGRRDHLVKEYGKLCTVSKVVTFRDRSRTSIAMYKVNESKEMSEEEINPELRELLNSIKIRYIHPQDGVELLIKAQEKLRDRLTLNWGRRGGVTDALEKIKKDWSTLRTESDSYLSKSLSSKLQDIWPGCEIKVNLPKKIEDVIKVSDIGIKGARDLPEIPLTSQGTGAQSIVLYLAHFLLDNDRSLNRGEYHPLWLLEEPESFLHADLIFQVGNQIASKEWLDNIQMIVSTHSPIILATSRQSESEISWTTMKSHSASCSKPLKDWDNKEIVSIGKEMGDSNFEAYFVLSKDEKYLFFIEDRRIETKKAFEKSGIKVSKALNGTSEINKYIDVHSSVASVIKQELFFLIDNDLGRNDFKRYLKKESLLNEKHEIGKYKVDGKISLLLLPMNCAVEDLFDEYDNYLREKVSEIYLYDDENKTYSLAKTISTELTRTVAALRGKDMPKDQEDAKLIIKNTQDIKDIFWSKIKSEDLKMSNKYIKALKELIGITNDQ